MRTPHDRLKAIGNTNDVPPVAVAVTITEQRNTHVGMLYRDDKDSVFLLHLKFNLLLANEPFDNTYLCVEPAIEPEELEVVAGYCRSIARQNPPIRFALHYNPKARFSRDKDVVMLTFERKGLNCSTFVLAVFQSAGLQLVDKNGWEERDSDKKWHKFLVAYLKKYPGASSAYWRSVAKDVGCARVRPEEVAGACLEDDLPAGFAQCVANGKTILRNLERHTSRTSRW